MDYITTSPREKLAMNNFRETLFDPLIDVADLTDYTGRPLMFQLPYLRKHELLPFFPKGKWQLKISFAQLIWLRIIETLRQFSYKVSDMQKLCDYFFKDAYWNNLPEQNIDDNIELLMKMKLAGTASLTEENDLENLKRYKEDPIFLQALKYDVNYLTNLVMQCIADREDTGILIFPGGRVMEYDARGYGNHNNEFSDVNEPHIRLSISYFLKEFIDDDELSTLLMPRLLNEDEHKVLKALNNKNVVQLKIQRKDSGELRLDTVTMGTITGEQAKEIKRILGLGNYEEIEMSTRDKKTLHFKKTKKNINSD